MADQSDDDINLETATMNEIVSIIKRHETFYGKTLIKIIFTNYSYVYKVK